MSFNVRLCCDLCYLLVKANWRGGRKENQKLKSISVILKASFVVGTAPDVGGGGGCKDGAYLFSKA